jgi:hypothetical protein
MRIKLTFAGLFGLAAVAALLAMAVWASAAGASEFKTSSFPVSFLGEGLGLSTFKSENDNLVVCHNSHSKGSIESTTLAKATITYLTSCELTAKTPLSFKEACPTITTKELDIKPVSQLNGGTSTGLLFTAASGTELAKFTCSGSNKVELKIKGSIICESTPIGSAVTRGQVICKQEGNEEGAQEFTTATYQESTTVVGEPSAESTLGIFKATEQDSQTTAEDIAYAAAVELTAAPANFTISAKPEKVTAAVNKSTITIESLKANVTLAKVGFSDPGGEFTFTATAPCERNYPKANEPCSFTTTYKGTLADKITFTAIGEVGKTASVTVKGKP